jgi:hypothetical protein
MSHLVADRSEQKPAEPADASAAYHDEVGVPSRTE